MNDFYVVLGYAFMIIAIFVLRLFFVISIAINMVVHIRFYYEYHLIMTTGV